VVLPTAVALPISTVVEVLLVLVLVVGHPTPTNPILSRPIRNQNQQPMLNTIRKTITVKCVGNRRIPTEEEESLVVSFCFGPFSWWAVDGPISTISSCPNWSTMSERKNPNIPSTIG